jgi:hypothetical protein
MDLPTPPYNPLASPMLTLADLSPEEKDKVQRIVEKVVSLGQENEELVLKYRQESQQHDALVSELRAKLQKTTGLLYLYQSTLESKIATNIGAENEVLLVEKQAAIDELRQNEVELESELETARTRVSSQDQQLADLTSQLQCGRKQFDEAKERCNRLEAACLGLTKQLAAMGLRMRTTAKDQQRSAEETRNNRCHASTQCGMAPREVSTSPGPTTTTTTTTSTVDKAAATAGKYSRSERILTMTGYVAVPVPFPTINETCHITCASEDDEIQLRRSTTSINRTTAATGQRAPRLHDVGDEEVGEEEPSPNRSRGSHDSTASASPCAVAQRRTVKRDEINAPRFAMAAATATVLRRRPCTSAESAVNSEKTGAVSARSTRRPLVDIDVGAGRSDSRSKQQIAHRKMNAATVIKPKPKQQQPQTIPNSSRVLFDGDYDADLFLLLDDIEKL